jgi:hypothetical protein
MAEQLKSLQIVNIHLRYCRRGLLINPKKYEYMVEALEQVKKGIDLDFGKYIKEDDIQRESNTGNPSDN